jgi:hypothetical protein
MALRKSSKHIQAQPMKITTYKIRLIQSQFIRDFLLVPLRSPPGEGSICMAFAMTVFSFASTT